MTPEVVTTEPVEDLYRESDEFTDAPVRQGGERLELLTDRKRTDRERR